jgi:23S rRNA pseudouridine2605 synthase
MLGAVNLIRRGGFDLIVEDVSPFCPEKLELQTLMLVSSRKEFMLERIQKIISAAGVTSRRAAEQLILDGRVRVNGQVVTELGTKADASKDHIKVDGKLINPRQPMTYIMLNKPAGFVTTMSDPEGRPTVLNLLKGLKVRVYPVGRLDYNTEGLLLLTNDGDFAHLITHPKHEFPKTYRAKVKGVLEDRQIDELERGIHLDDGRTAPAKIKKISKEEANSWLEITIHEGKKRQVRRMFDRVGHSVIKLKRIRTGNLVLGDLPEGTFRYLTPEEVEALKELAVKEEKPGIRSSKPEVRSQGAGIRSRESGARSQGAGVRSQESGVRSRETRVTKPWSQGSRGKDHGVTAETRPRGVSSSGRGPVREQRDEARRPDRSPRATVQRTSTGPVSREGRTPLSTTRRPRPDDRRTAPYGQGTRTESTWKSQGPRVPGQGASGRGPRRPPRAEGSMQSRATTFPRPGAGGRPDFKEKSGRSTGTDRPGQALRSQGAPKSSAFKPKGKKTIAARIRGKIFDKSTEQKQRTERTAGAGGRDRKPPRTYGTPERGTSTVQGAGRKPYRTRS